MSAKTLHHTYIWCFTDNYTTENNNNGFETRIKHINYVVLVLVIFFQNCIKNNLDSVKYLIKGKRGRERKYRSRSNQQVCPTCHVTAFQLPTKT